MRSATAFDIHSFSEDSLYGSLCNEACVSSEVADKRQAQYLFRYLQAIEAKTLVVEYDYTDGDYLDDYASYYATCFNHYPRRCKRLHFFSVEFKSDQFEQWIRGELEDADSFRDSYLGFAVARPLPDAIIGRTVLKTYESDGGRRNYTCTKTYRANLFGIELAVESLAYQEQDTVLSACATVALWCCFHKTSELFVTPCPRPATITRRATAVVHHSRPIPSHGLNVQQMCNAIKYFGLEPEVILVNENVPLVSLLYGHLKMGLPVLVGVQVEGIGRHALTLTGYSLQENQVRSEEVAGNGERINMTGLRIDEFYAHDDQIGPFSRLHVAPSKKLGNTTYPVTFESSWAANGKNICLYPYVVIVPVYHKIRVTFLDVTQWLTRMNAVLKSVVPPDTPLDWDVSLTTTNDYKQAVKSSALPKKDLQAVLLKQHPRFIWRASLSVSGVKIVELLADATDMARSFPIYQVLWFHEPFQNALRNILTTVDSQTLLTPRFWSLLDDSMA